MIVAIDGPSGAGKSTLSKLLAERLQYTHIDTGAMYRCVALAAYRAGIDPDATQALKDFCQTLEIRFDGNGQNRRVLLNDEDVSEAIRTPENSLRTSTISANPVVRDAMVDLQRAMGQQGNVVLEGRDIGSVVFPKADVKLFLTATADERGQRRYQELKSKGMDVELSQTIAEVEARDAADSNREHAPLIEAPDAIRVDSTGVSIEGVLEQMVAIVERRRRPS